MRRLALCLFAAALLASCTKDTPPVTQPDTGTVEDKPDAATCEAPCGTLCCELGQKCNETSKVCEACTPACDGKACGDDGCGGSCGTCTGANASCEAGVCKTCAKPLCDGVCCPAGESCDATTKKCAACTPTCDGKDCGDNGCGGSCGGCLALQVCNGNKCEGCMPDCEVGQKCGTDKTGCTCGTCPSDQYCSGGKCAFCPRPLCNGTCCLEGEECNVNTLACEPCVTQCASKVCGIDGCGGWCPPGCQAAEKCASGGCSTCTQVCGTRACGNDKTGCNCGLCTGETTCVEGLCQPCPRPLCNGVCCEPGSKCDPATKRCQRCQPQCEGKLCGDDGCGGLCGGCDPGNKCVAGKCEACTPACAGKDCGDDGCNGVCGTCDPQKGLFCIASKCATCQPEQDADICARLNAECGVIPTVDNCGNPRGPDCGATCPAGKACDGASHTCQVPCAPETDAAFCTRQGRECGSATGADNCGAARFVNTCGTCTGTACNAGKCL